jgi:hypothetical protein
MTFFQTYNLRDPEVRVKMYFTFLEGYQEFRKKSNFPVAGQTFVTKQRDD